MKFIISLILSGLTGFSLLWGTTVATRANSGSVIDFEGLTEGLIVDSVSSGNGISGEVVTGSVEVHGRNPNFPATNAAMTFDATCSPGGQPSNCTGGDADLYNPSFGNILIISEDLDSSDPDDADVVGGVFNIVFTSWGSGKVTVESIDVQDVELDETENARIEFFAEGIDSTSLGAVSIPETGNGGHAHVTVGKQGVGSMRIDLQGSGAIDNIRITTEPTAVKLLYFRVEKITGQDVSLSWATEAEIDNYGFRVYRSSNSNLDRAIPIHFEPSAGGIAGHSYAYVDHVPQEGGWWYWLSDVDTRGQETFHGPVYTEVGTPKTLDHQIFMPVAILQTRR